jgi:hypothetical protein
VISVRTVIWIAVVVALGWAVARGVQAFLQAHPRPTL